MYDVGCDLWLYGRCYFLNNDAAVSTELLTRSKDICQLIHMITILDYCDFNGYHSVCAMLNRVLTTVH